jgi:hypothetical protein
MKAKFEDLRFKDEHSKFEYNYILSDYLKC